MRCIHNGFRAARAVGLMAGMFALVLAACGGATPTTAPQGQVPAAGGETTVDKSKLSAELALYNWSEYIAPDVIKKFEQEYGVKVTIDSYEDNESLFAKFQAGGNPGYDLVLPSDYMIEKMIKAGMLDKIDFGNVPNIKNIDPSHLNLYYDPQQEYNAPYFWGTTGIAYDPDRVKKEITSWKDIFEPADEIKGKIGFLNDQREVMAAALRYLGYSGNTTAPAQIEAAKKLLLEHKKDVAGFFDSIV
ncbi:MAG: spermidine/putrescine ABC transporter substrate-binding protein, partial [bacterium]